MKSIVASFPVFVQPNFVHPPHHSHLFKPLQVEEAAEEEAIVVEEEDSFSEAADSTAVEDAAVAVVETVTPATPVLPTMDNVTDAESLGTLCDIARIHLKAGHTEPEAVAAAMDADKFLVPGKSVHG